MVLLALIAVVFGAVAGLDWWRGRLATIRFVVAADSAAVRLPESIELTFFPFELAFAAPSPPAPLGTRRAGPGGIVVGAELVPERVRVRYSGAGIAAGVAYVERGAEPNTITIAAPQSLRGRVGEPFGYWCMGWRCAGYRPVAGAEVELMAGGEHGIPIASARTDANGTFELTGFDGDLDALGLRVRADGFALAHRSLVDLDTHRDERALVAISRVRQRRGRLAVDASLDLDPTSVLVLARGLPGVQARPEADGSFVLDHVPDGVEARIVVFGLSEAIAQQEVRTAVDREVEVALLRGADVAGIVCDRFGDPVAGASVWTEGHDPIVSDAYGRFRLRGVWPGSVEVTAQHKASRRAPTWLGTGRLELEPGGACEDFVIRLDRAAR